jgi:riboflavin-specific deaminase-like protein
VKRSERPFVFLNMAMTVDGKVSTYARTPTTFPSKADKRHLLELRAEADAIMVGASTARTDHMSMGIPDAGLRRQRLRRGMAEHPLRVIVTGRFSIEKHWEVFRHRFSPILIFTTQAAPSLRRHAFESVARIYACGRTAVDLREALRILRRDWGVKRLLCEGGPTLNWSLFRLGLVDEVNLTLCPRIFGGVTAPTLVDGKGFLPNDAPGARLVSVKRIGDELFLVYRLRQGGRS